MTVVEKIKKLIAAGKLKEAIAEFANAATGDSDMEAIALNLQMRFGTLENERNMGIITSSSAGVERMKITQSLISSLGNLPPPVSEPTKLVEKPKTLEKNGWVADKNDIKILFLASNPSDQAILSLEKEFTNLHGVLQDVNEIRLFSEQQVSPTRLQDAILERKPQILHFSGHGIGDGINETDPSSLTGKRMGIGEIEGVNPEEGLFFVNEKTKKAQIVTADALDGLFGLVKDEGVDLRLVVLNACFSESVAAEILHHVPFVIGMQRAIRDEDAIEFTKWFYRELAATKLDVPKSFKRVQQKMKLNGIEDWDIAVLRAREA